MTDLVKQLRAAKESGDPWVAWHLALQTADRIEKLEAALRTVKEWHGYGLPLETTRIIDAALEGKDDSH